MALSWLSTLQFAEVSGMARQPANRLLREFVEGRTRPWRGRVLIVEILQGRRGRGGKAYRVKISSLPVKLQERLKGPSKPVSAPSQIALPGPDIGTPEMRWRMHILAPVLATAEGSTERAAAINALVGTQPIGPSGYRVKPLKRSTIYRWVRAIETDGLAGAGRKGRADRHQERVMLGRELDAMTRLDAETAARIRDTLRKQVKGWLIKGGTRSRVETHCIEFFKQLLRSNGVRINDDEALTKACRVPISRLYKEEKDAARKVYDRRFDRKRSDDSKPRVQRLAPQLPAECYVLDVHHINVLVTGRNGKVGTVKMLACEDWGTGRVTADFVFFELRGGVRNVDNIELMRRVFADPAWGVCQYLYVDNGKEYGFARFINAMLELNARGVELAPGLPASRVINSLPYNASAKPVENGFHQHNNHEFRHLPGFIGDDRMKPMTVAPGKLPKSFGQFDDFVEFVEGLMKAYNNQPQQSGRLKGQSPNSAFRAHVENGWAATVLDPQDFDGVFVKRELRDLRQHAVRVGNRLWTHEALDTSLGNKVVACIPIYHGFNELRIEDLNGNFICIAKPNEILAWNDPRGARTSAERTSRRNKAISAYAAGAAKVDPLAERIAFGAAHPDPVPNPPNGRIAVNLNGPSAKVVTPRHSPKRTLEQEQDERRALIEAQLALTFKKRNSA